jgi:MFS family permease
LRATIVAGIGGLVIGHVLWLIAISLAIDTTSVSTWVLVVSAVCLVVAVIAGLLGRRFHERKAYAKAWFAWCLPMAPVLLSVIVLGVTYL